MEKTTISYIWNRTYRQIRLCETEHTAAFLDSRPNTPTISYNWN